MFHVHSFYKEKASRHLRYGVKEDLLKDPRGCTSGKGQSKLSLQPRHTDALSKPG